MKIIHELGNVHELKKECMDLKIVREHEKVDDFQKVCEFQISSWIWKSSRVQKIFMGSYKHLRTEKVHDFRRNRGI